MWHSSSQSELYWQSIKCMDDPKNCGMTPLDGVVTWPSMKFKCISPDTACEGPHTLTFYVASVSGDTSQINSQSFDLSWTAFALSMTTVPSGCLGGQTCTIQPVVSIRDSAGYLVASQDTGEVTVAIAVAPTGNSAAELRGATRMQIKGGMASFTDLSIDMSHANAYIIQFVCSMPALARNVSLTVDTGAPYALVLTQQPGSVLPGVLPGKSFSVRIVVQDAGGNQWKSVLGVMEPFITAVLDREDTTLGSPILSGSPCTGSTGVCVQQMSNNAATFNGLRVDKAPALYRLKLTGSPGEVALETFSDFFFVQVGSLGEMRCFAQPQDILSGTLLQPIIVRQHDDGGNFMYAENSMQVELTIHKGSGVLNGTTIVTVVNGEAIFSSVNVTLFASTISSHIHVLHFRAGVVEQLSNPFSVMFRAAKAKLATFPPRFVSVGEVFSTQPELACLDASDNLVTSSQDVFSTSAFLLGASLGTELKGTTTVQSFAGIASFTDLSLVGTAAEHRLSFTFSFVSSTVITWNVTAGVGAPAQLQIIDGYEPGALGGKVPAGDVLPRQPRVRLLDVGNNAVDVHSETVKCVLLSHQDRAAFPQLVLGGSLEVHVIGGTAIFTNLAINIRGIYSLVFWHKSHRITSSNFTVTTGPIAQLVYENAPPNAVFGQVFNVQPRILLMDRGGNRVLGSPWIHMRVLQTTLPSLTGHKSHLTECSSVLDGVCNDVTNLCKGYALPDSGVVEFQGCQILQTKPYVPEKHRLIVSTLESFDGAHGSDPHPLRDIFGNVVTDSVQILETDEFLVSSAEVAIRFNTTVPAINSPLCLSSVFTPQPCIEIIDSTGSLVPSFVGLVHVQLLASPKVAGTAHPKITGNLEAPFINGQAQFTDLGFSGTGGGLVMRFIANGTSLPASQNITAQTIDHSAVAFVAGMPIALFAESVSPSIVAGAKPTGLTVPRLYSKDCWDNLANLCSNVSVSVTGLTCDDHDNACISPGPLSACFNSSFRSLPEFQLFKSGLWNMTISLSSSTWGLIHATIGPIEVTSGQVTNIKMISQPMDTLMDTSMSPAPAISAIDPYGNRIIGCSSAGVVTTKIVATINSPLINGAGLKGLTVAIVNCLSGFAVFSELQVDTPGFEFTMTFSVSSDVQVISNSFSVSGPPVALKLLSVSRLALNSKWIGGTPNANKIHALVIDAGGNPSFVQDGHVSVSIGDFGFTMSGDLHAATKKGIAVFDRLIVDKVGRLQLRFTYPLSDQNLFFMSSPIEVISGAASQLGITTQPGWSKNEGGVAFPWQPALQVQDAGGNPVAHLTAVTASLAVVATPGAATSGTTIKNTQASGAVIYDNLAVDLVGSGYRLRFSADQLESITSDTLNISTGLPSRLAVMQQPDITYSGSAYPFLIHVQDAGGNFAIGNCTTIVVSVSKNSVNQVNYPNTTFVLTPPVASINGIAFFPSITMPIALPYLRLAFTCTQEGVSWTPAVSKQFAVGHSLALANCPGCVGRRIAVSGTKAACHPAAVSAVSSTSCGPPAFRSSNLVLESFPEAAEVGGVLGHASRQPRVQARDNDGMPINVPATTVYARLSNSAALPVEATRIQGVVMKSNSSASITFPDIRSDVSGQAYLSFVAGFDSGLQLISKSAGIFFSGSTPTALNFLSYLARRIVLKSTASTSLQLKDVFDNVANAVVGTCRVGMYHPTTCRILIFYHASRCVLTTEPSISFSVSFCIPSQR
jgi:hypothetical protein